MNQAGLGWAIGASLLACLACGGPDNGAGGTAGAAGDGASEAGAGQTGSAGSDGVSGSAGAGASSGSAGSGTNTAGAANNAGAAGKSNSAGSAGRVDDGDSYTGSVQVGWSDNGAAFSTTAQAYFAVPKQSTGRNCTTEVIGSCNVLTCMTATQPAMVPQAGTITLTNGDKFNATLMPNGDGGYNPNSQPQVLLPGDDNITITATGGDVPAFSSVIVQPLTLLVTSPLATSGQLDGSRDTDLALKFDRGVPGVQLLVEGGQAPGVSMNCSFPSEAGEASIPAAAMKQLSPSTTVYLFTYKVETITAGQYTIDLKAFSAAMDPAKMRGIRVIVQ